VKSVGCDDKSDILFDNKRLEIASGDMRENPKASEEWVLGREQSVGAHIMRAIQSRKSSVTHVNNSFVFVAIRTSVTYVRNGHPEKVEKYKLGQHMR
jgi:hypothetical protein